VLDPASEAGAMELVVALRAAARDLPLVVCPDGTVLRNPVRGGPGAPAGHAAGTTRSKRVRRADRRRRAGGPVHGGVCGVGRPVGDRARRRAFGGQAGASARIENYLGFPTGISGQALAGRAFVQAQKFGAEMMIPAEVAALDCDARTAAAPDADDGSCVKARAVVLACGARYRRPALERLDAFEGCGVYYWASPIEAKLCANEEVVLVGGGNSAGQAAVFLSSHAARVHMLIRGPSLAASMSSYLIERIEATANITLHTHTELTALEQRCRIGRHADVAVLVHRLHAEEVVVLRQRTVASSRCRRTAHPATAPPWCRATRCGSRPGPARCSLPHQRRVVLQLGGAHLDALRRGRRQRQRGQRRRVHPRHLGDVVGSRRTPAGRHTAMRRLPCARSGAGALKSSPAR
jgi:hypothetical protein